MPPPPVVGSVAGVALLDEEVVLLLVALVVAAATALTVLDALLLDARALVLVEDKLLDTEELAWIIHGEIERAARRSQRSCPGCPVARCKRTWVSS